MIFPKFQFFFNKMIDKVKIHFFDGIGVKTFFHSPFSSLQKQYVEPLRSFYACCRGFKFGSGLHILKPLTNQLNNLSVNFVYFRADIRYIFAFAGGFYVIFINLSCQLIYFLVKKQSILKKLKNICCSNRVTHAKSNPTLF